MAALPNPKRRDDGGARQRDRPGAHRPPQANWESLQVSNDLNADIEAGWTAHGQTNFLLGRIAMRAYIFEHLDGAQLVTHIVTTAKMLPGYRDWCQHQQEIGDRAEHWARSITNSRYFPYGTTPTNTSSNPIEMTWNQHQSNQARERIRAAIAMMLDLGTLPASTTDRFIALKEAGIGSSTL